MAHLTNGAVDGVLGYLSKAVKDEAKLLSTVQRDIQFIKDEDSMNGFLMYLTKKKASTHLEKGLRAIEVERRCDQVEDGHVSLAYIEAYKTLKKDVMDKQLPLDVADQVSTIMGTVMMRKDAVSAKMLLRAVYADPYGITKLKLELEELLNNLKERSAVLHDNVMSHHVMVLCYSKLSTHHKSCLQYLTTFGEEKSISRTCLVRRWLAEGLVAKDQQQQGGRLRDGSGDDISMEEAGERYFNELVFRGFIRPAPPLRPAGLKIKSCIMDPSVKTFISKSDNFIDDLPTHLQRQIEIRKLLRSHNPHSTNRGGGVRCRHVSFAATTTMTGKPLPPMDEMVMLLKDLPEEYRLHVLDLGGCTGLTMLHLTNICELVPSLKYLSLRKTNVFLLPSQMNLLHLETLDIRDTRLQANALRNILIQELRHLFAGYVSEVTVDAAQLSTVKIPKKLGKNTEILKHVQIIDDGRQAQAQLRRVGSLKRLRKMGIVLSGSQENMAHLLTTISMRSESLRSLSIWITTLPLESDGGFVTVDSTIGGSVAKFFSPPEKLETLNLKCFKGNSTRGSIPQWIKGLQFLSKITLRHSLLY
uniref:Rx N-terminal domain-containing protein n=1 Tax=Oryza nivara TaxID=4536 RepID=A0A0E0J547_ORYNI